MLLARLHLHHLSQKNVIELKCPYGKVGDVLWVRETFKISKKGERYQYLATDENHSDKQQKWKPSIHMPFEACRLFLKIKGIRIERLQDITKRDSISEGISIKSKFGDVVNTWMDYTDGNGTPNPSYSFMTLWQSVYGSKSWEDNPWVWVIEFKQITKEEALS